MLSSIASRRRGAALLATVGVALLPWAASLNLQLSARHVVVHWNLAWTGFDVLLALALLATARGLLRQRPWLPVAGAVAATLLVCDAWFDVLTASGWGELIAAAALAGGAELPLAFVCIRYAVRAAARSEWRHPIGGHSESSDSCARRVSASAASRHV